MKAAVIHRYGGPEELRIEDLPDPHPGSRDVLIEVHASSVNPVDWKLRSGIQRVIAPRSFPSILGLDVSGVVVEKGSAVTEFNVGDEVYSSPTHRRDGTYAQLVAINVDEVAKKPTNITHGQAASIPLVGLTAWQSLVTKGRIERGQKVFIAAGSGGIGTFAIQLAKHFGAEVTTTCSARNFAFVQELGADHVIDYAKERFDEKLRDFDLAFDTMGGEQSSRCLRILRSGGRVVSISVDMKRYVKQYGALLGAAAAGLWMVGFSTYARAFYDVRSSHVVRKCDGRMLGQITRIVESGSIKPVVDRVFRLDDIAEAHRYSETGRARGKIVVMVK